MIYEEQDFMQDSSYKELPQSQKEIYRELCVRFLNKPRICRKVNETFIGSNKRIVVVEDGRFVYYRSITDFVDLKPQKLKRQIPKAGVQIRDIKQLRFPPKKIKDKNYFQIVFPKNRMLKFIKEKKNYEFAVDKSISGTQIWQFEFDYDIVVLPTIERRQLQQQREQAKRNQVKVQQKQQFQDQQQANKQKQALDRDKFLKFFEEKNQNQENIKEVGTAKAKEKQDKQLQNNYDKKQRQKIRIQTAYQSRYHDIWIRNVSRLTFDQTIKLQMELFQLMGIFKERAVENVKFIIGQLIFHPKYRSSKIKQLDRVQKYFMLEQDEISFAYNGMNIKLSCVYRNKQRYPLISQYGSNSLSHSMQEFQTVGFKRKNLQFLAYNILSDIVWVLKRQKDLDIKVPLACLVQYRGFKALCVADLPINIAESLLVGFSRDKMSYKRNQGVNDNLKMISTALGLKSFTLATNKNSVQVFLAQSTQLHRTIKNPYPEARLSKNRDQQYSYLIRFKDLFPIDVELNKSLQYTYRKLRPEFLYQHYHTPLSSGAFLYAQESKSQEQDVDLTKAAKYMRQKCINNLVGKLDRMQFLPLDSQNLSKLFHEQGVNMRYLGEVASRSSLPHVKQYCQIECMARMAKKIFRAQLSEFTFFQFRQRNAGMFSDIEREQNKFRQEHMIFDMKSKSVFDKLQKDLELMVLDFLNLVFSNSSDTTYFWKKIIIPLAEKYFNYKNPISFQSIPHPLLYHVTIYHLRIKVRTDQDIPIFNSMRPFVPGTFLGFLTKVENYSFNSSYINRLHQKISTYSKVESTEKQKKVALSTFNLILTTQKSLKTSSFPIHGPSKQASLLTQMAQFQLESKLSTGHVERAIQNCLQAQKLCPKNHPWMLLILIQQINSYSVYQPHISLKKFDEALNLIRKTLTNSHPINGLALKSAAQAHLLAKKHSEGILLYQSALSNLIQSIGMGHMKTIQVFIQLGRAYLAQQSWLQGLQMLKKAATFVRTSIQNGQKNMTSFVHLEIARVCLNLNRPEESQKYCQECLKMIDQNFFLKSKVDVLGISAKANYMLNKYEKVLKRCQAMFQQLQKQKEPNLQDYEFILTISVQAFLQGKKEQYKNFYYKILLAVKYNYYQEEFVRRVPRGLQIVEKEIEYLIPPLSIEAKNKALKSFILYSKRNVGTLVIWVRQLFTTLQSVFSQIYMDSKFTQNFQEFLKGQSKEFVESMGDFISLLKYYGEKFFVDILRNKIVPRLSNQ